jgi:hypothetical protein
MNKLDKELKEIQDGLAEGLRLFMSSKQLTYTKLVEAYFWWRRAEKRKGYLDALYAGRGISNYKDFHKLVDLIFRLRETNQTQNIGNYSYAVEAIHKEYEANSFRYKHIEDKVSALVRWMFDNGGISGLRGRNQQQKDDFGGDDDSVSTAKKTAKSTKRTDTRLVTEAQVIQQKKDRAKNTKTGKQVDFGEVATNDDELVVVLAKRSDYGKLTIIGTTADEAVVDRALLEIGDIDYSSTAPVLRTLVEALKPNIIPKRLQQQKVRAKFYNKTKVKHSYTNKKGVWEEVVLTEKTRLVLRKNGTILVSKTTASASLTTVAKPNIRFGNKTDVFLRGSDRYWLETDLLNEAQIILYDAEPKKKLAKASDKVNADFQITLSNTRSKSKRNLYFYNTDAIDGGVGFQADIADAESIKYGWNITASATYIQRLYAKHLEKWLYGMNKGIKLTHNLHMLLHCTSKHLEIQSDWQNEKYQQQGKEFQTVFEKDAKSKVHSKDTKITVSPLDIVQVFATICDAQLTSSVVIEGNKHLLHIQYSTDAADFDVYVPACNHKGVRDDTHFTTAYGND